MFFENEEIAIAAGYRPCAVCLPEQYARWKASE
ncbi:Ada metal-binding domain-containing protein [Paenibacillus alginolyticus]|nr:Ada metal-binding domain-containing protein [Paenibacillus alginolyticus]